MDLQNITNPINTAGGESGEKFAIIRQNFDSLTEKINQNFETIRTASYEIVLGTYVGDGAVSRIINLGFEPIAIFVRRVSGGQYDSGGDSVSYGLSLKHSNSSYIGIVENGFKVFKYRTFRYISITI